MVVLSGSAEAGQANDLIHSAVLCDCDTSSSASSVSNSNSQNAVPSLLFDDTRFS